MTGMTLKLEDYPSDGRASLTAYGATERLRGAAHPPGVHRPRRRRPGPTDDVVQVRDQDAGVPLAGRLEVVLDSEVEFDTA